MMQLKGAKPEEDKRAWEFPELESDPDPMAVASPDPESELQLELDKLFAVCICALAAAFVAAVVVAARLLSWGVASAVADAVAQGGTALFDYLTAHWPVHHPNPTAPQSAACSTMIFSILICNPYPVCLSLSRRKK